jgi:alkanesulfonate monooxygenase SsuD/methylene tetrahydromethanopterin reductase-like flavin-dependent oxidoreductase (luciferase family)
MMRSFDRLKVTLSGKFRPHNPKVPQLIWFFRSTVEGYAKFSPANSKWTKHTVAEHVSLGGNGPLFVGTPSQVADSLQVWIDEADVDGFNFVSS